MSVNATSLGTVSNEIDSDSTGIVANSVGGPTNDGDDTTVTLRGVKVSALGLNETALSDTTYSASGHLASNTVYGSTAATADTDALVLSTGGLTILAEDESSFAALGSSVGFDTQPGCRSASCSSRSMRPARSTSSTRPFRRRLSARA